MDMKCPPPLTAVCLGATIDSWGLSPFAHVIGYSIQRRPLMALRLGEGSPTMLYVAGHHAMEWICGWVLLTFAKQLQEGTDVPGGTFWIVPALNPDGIELVSGGFDESALLSRRQLRANRSSRDFSHWQANARGVDLNHNYPFGFDAYRQVETELGIFEGAPAKYSGVAPLSEPETQALASLIDLVEPDAVLTLHTQGEEVFYGITPPLSAYMLAHLAARRLGYKCSVPTGTAAYGGLTDWLVARGMYALTLECGRGVNPLAASAYPSMERRLLPLLSSMSKLVEYVNKLLI